MLYKKVQCIISKRAELHLEDSFGIQNCWDMLVELLGNNETETIECLNICSPNELSWISEVFEDISYKLQSEKYIDCLKKLDTKYPELELTRSIITAENYLK